MPKDAWLPKGYRLPDGTEIKSFLFSGQEWQIFSIQGAGNLLVARFELAQKWYTEGFLEESLFSILKYGSVTYGILRSDRKYVLAPVESVRSPDRKTDAMSFSLSVRESRKISEDASFHDAIYVEQYSRLLPTWTLSPYVKDEVVLGTWMAGGVIISTDSFRRLSNLTGWMSQTALAEVVEAAGLNVPDNIGMHVSRPKSKTQATDDKATTQPDRGQLSRDGIERNTFTLPGRPQLELFFNEHVIDIVSNPDKYLALGVEFPSAIILHGPPGCGKTFAVERLVEFIDWPSYPINSSTVGSPYIHETSKKISEIFDKAIDSSPSVIIIDEMESFLSDRRSGGTLQQHHVEEVSEFLRRIPEAIASRVLVIAMTNMIELIDSAILRKGRFDHIIEVGMPSINEVSSLVESLLNKIPKSNNLDLTVIAEELTGRPLSDVAFVVRESARLAAKAGKKMIDQESIEEALQQNIPHDQEKKERRIGFIWDS